VLLADGPGIRLSLSQSSRFATNLRKKISCWIFSFILTPLFIGCTGLRGGLTVKYDEGADQGILECQTTEGKILKKKNKEENSVQTKKKGQPPGIEEAVSK